MTERFHAEHDREFGYHVPGEPVQILTVGATAVATRLAADDIRPPASTASSVPEPKARRAVVFDDGSEHHVPVFDRSALPVGKPMKGPAVIEEFDSTTLVPPGYHFEVVELGALRLRRLG